MQQRMDHDFLERAEGTFVHPSPHFSITPPSFDLQEKETPREYIPLNERKYDTRREKLIVTANDHSKYKSSQTPYAPYYTKASPIPIGQMKGKNKHNKKNTQRQMGKEELCTKKVQVDPVLVMKR
jgi:hypothetical protein